MIRTALVAAALLLAAPAFAATPDMAVAPQPAIQCHLPALLCPQVVVPGSAQLDKRFLPENPGAVATA
jgi:hypothetical protein